VAQCANPDTTQRIYEFNPRGSQGRLPWTYDLGASLTYLQNIGQAKLRVDLSVFNLLDSQELTEVNENRQISLTEDPNPLYLQGTGYQSPRSAQLKVTVDF
ncbi:MAG TPA: TonB-dependent receptor, partial [Xanthomonadaceae bacterium]|nr:TonB-dependent receptor [Xanthomonadaceae bacterium]